MIVRGGMLMTSSNEKRIPHLISLRRVVTAEPLYRNDLDSNDIAMRIVAG